MAVVLLLWEVKLQQSDLFRGLFQAVSVPTEANTHVFVDCSNGINQESAQLSYSQSAKTQQNNKCGHSERIWWERNSRQTVTAKQ